MPRNEVQQQGLMPSLIDRLIDPDAEGTQFRYGYSLEQVIDSVRRDLEDLLNSHPAFTKVPPAFPEVADSVLQFGMVDLMAFDASTPVKRDELAHLIEDVVHRFEPRLRDVRAILAEKPGTDERSLRFHIEAKVNVDPAPEVAFETVLELMTGHASIKAREV
jgi:type VI secretion system protein ImpF